MVRKRVSPKPCMFQLDRIWSLRVELVKLLDQALGYVVSYIVDSIWDTSGVWTVDKHEIKHASMIARCRSTSGMTAKCSFFYLKGLENNDEDGNM